MEKLFLGEIRAEHIGKEYELSGEISKIGKIRTGGSILDFECRNCRAIIKVLNGSLTLRELICPFCKEKIFTKLPGDENIEEQIIEIIEAPNKPSVIFSKKVYVNGMELINKFKELKKKDRITIIGEIGAEPSNKTDEKFIIFAKDIF